MPARLRFLIGYFLAWLLFFEAARGVFLLLQWSHSRTLPARELLGSFWYGGRMDASMAAYLSLPVAVFLLISVFVPFFRRPAPYQVYSLLLLLPVLLIVLSDVPMYQIWGFRIDATPLKYLSNPREAWASVSHLPVWWYALAFVLLYAALCRAGIRLLRRTVATLQQRERWYIVLPLLLGATAALIIPLRGGLQQTPLNQSSVYFSTNHFANQAALNAPWNFLFGVVSETSAGSETNPYTYMSAPDAKRIADSLLHDTAEGESELLRRTDMEQDRVNILLVIWESGTAKMIDTAIDGIEVTPGLNRLKQEGLYFGNAWASGDRTDKGVPAILSGYPALPQSSIIRLPNKANRLHTLGGVLRKQGYRTSFYYGGEPEFANLKSYLLHNSFDPLIEKSDFHAKDQNSKWGAHDGIVAERLLRDLAPVQEPFFTTWLTLSSHEPFETPAATVIPGTDDAHLFLNSLHYTDSVLYRFVRSCERQSWWKKTLLVIVADHGHALPETGSRIENFRIPVLILGGALNPVHLASREHFGRQTVSQLDLAATLAIEAGLDGAALFPFSRNILRMQPADWAFFSFNNGFGFVRDSSWVLFDNVGRQPIGQSAGNNASLIRAGQALQQQTFQDYLGK
ncbi:LTA synthase family protein [Flaviaesturariibacter amylovorans]|uniref:Alkaline phosphatase family protein n=1 Tax=Flaviaesturariibacter amylovorans TaxID=1084520 RepID=A0ABP8GLV9_9BACT